MNTPLNFPPIEASIKLKDDKHYIFDLIRKKYLLITPEEWVRQHIIHFLINHKNYSKSLISTEKGLNYNKLAKRSDILTFSKNGTPFLLIECKAPEIKINDKVFEQVSIYNQTIQAPFIAVSNGLSTYICSIDFEKNSYTFLEDFPEQL